MREFISTSEEETIRVGEEFAKGLSAGEVVILTGDLGAGKTHFVKGIARGLGVGHWERVRSPTFSFKHTYYGRVPLYHFDLYRVKDIDDLETLGIDPIDLEDGVIAIEWGEKYGKSFENFFDKKIHIVKIEILDEKRRRIVITD